MPKKILTIGMELAGGGAEQRCFSSKASLLDWDIILFKPDISGFIPYYHDDYMGKPSLDDDDSFILREACEHWRREIKEAVENDKTVFAFLSELKSLYIATGQKEFSGTGRNQKVTRIVAEYTNYSSFPHVGGMVATKGAEMVLVRDHMELFHDYWEVFGADSFYNVVFPNDAEGACITTKSGNRPVSLFYRSKVSNGTLVLLPDVDFEDQSFFEEREEKTYFTEAAKIFSAKMIKAVIGIDRGLRSTGEFTPAPEWVMADKYDLSVERKLREELLLSETAVEKAQKEKEALSDKLSDAGKLKALLYETGKPLELAILEALRILGFSAEGYEENESEFDAVFECKEGRLLGEAEGKDTKAINITKLRQLAMNIHEDLEREEVEEPAKGILFGNGYRLTKLEEREVQFTKKCISAAKSTSVGLLATSDLYAMAKFVSDNSDVGFAKKCRKLLIDTMGVIEPPDMPVEDSIESDDTIKTT